MNAVWTSSVERQRKRKRRNRRILFSVLILFIAISIRAFMPGSPDASVPAPELVTPPPVATIVTEPAPKEIPAAPVVPDNIFTRDISDGDTLSAIFDGFHIDQQTMYQVLAADEQLLALDVMRPGNRLTFTLDPETRALQTMELFIHAGKQVLYKRADTETFEFEEIEIPGDWQENMLSGEIHGSFFGAAMAAGLTEQETANIADLLDAKLNFSRDIRAGDRFEVIRSDQYVNGVRTGQSQILGIRINGDRYKLDAFLFEDGNYYDHKGESLARAFRRYPFAGNYRISSPFNPRRKHPVTGRISPHNGTDFAMPSGTRILSPGDGVVTRVISHPYAGKYVEIQHGSHYKTRFLHLSKILVKRGQHVERGQTIALSGNTGRSTGPHLHYEMHINSRVVNAVQAKIPMAASIPKDKLPKFKELVATITAKMDQKPEQVAQAVKEHVTTDAVNNF